MREGSPQVVRISSSHGRAGLCACVLRQGRAARPSVPAFEPFVGPGRAGRASLSGFQYCQPTWLAVKLSHYLEPLSLDTLATLRHFPRLLTSSHHATYFSPTPQETRPPDRVSCAHGHPGRPQSPGFAPSQGPQAADGCLTQPPAHRPCWRFQNQRFTMRFRTEQHLRRQAEIRAVREKGERLDCRSFTAWCHRRDPKDEAGTPRLPRLVVAASIAAVGPAVLRNRAKRRLREIFRRHQDLLPAGTDLLLVARAAVTRRPFAELDQVFVEACGKINRPKPAL